MRILSIAGGALLVVIAAVALIGVGSSKNGLAEAAGKLDAQSVRARMWLKIEDGSTMEGPIVSTARGVRAQWKATAVYPKQNNAELGIDVLLVDEQSWYRFEEGIFDMPRGKTWVRDPEGSVNGGMTMGELASFLQRADDVERKGGQTLRGQEVDYYAGRANAHEAAKAHGGKTWENWQAKYGDADIYVDVQAWIDKQGLPRRLAVQYQSVQMQVDILEYGVPVDLRAPTASETISEAELDKLNPA
jgi:hypothetical protein